MQVQYLELDQIIPYEFNNRTHPQQQIDRIANSISLFGFNQPIVVDESSTILVGHGRWAAAKKLGLVKAPVLLRAGLSETDKRAYRILDNKLQNDSGWDYNNLELELGSLEDSGFDLKAWDLDTLLPPMPELEAASASEDDFDPTSCDEQETYIKLGDVIELGPHRVACVDCLKPEDVSNLFGDVRSKLLFTSPPYSDLREYEGNVDLSIDNLVGFLPVWRDFNEFMAVNLGLKFKDSEIVPYWDEYLSAASSAGLKLISWNVWDRLHAGSIGHATRMFRVEHEWIFVFGANSRDLRRTVSNDSATYHGKDLQKGKISSVREADGSIKKTKSKIYAHRQIGTVCRLTFENGAITKDHPATMPVGLPSEYIQAFCDIGDVVSDCFLGSGTTLIAAEQLGRICYGTEISPKYCQVIIERYRKHCEKVGKPFDCKINGERFAGYES